jgi:hypothetical protein
MLMLQLYYLMLMMTASQRQTTLDGSVVRQPRVAPFSTRGLIDHLVELIVSEDHSFYLLDKPAFRQLLHYLRPTLSRKDIPHRTRIRQETLARAVEAESKVKETLQVCSSRLETCLKHEVLTCYKRVKGEISFTFDTWTSEGSTHSYISVTAHYIDSPDDQPDQWVLKEDQLAFAPLEGHHTGANIASILASILKWYGICKKVHIISTFLYGL